MMLFCFWRVPGCLDLGALFLCGGGTNGGTNGQTASGAAAWSCLVRSFRRVILVHRFRNNNTTHLSVNPIAQV